MFSTAHHGTAATGKLPGWRLARAARSRVGVQLDDRRVAVVRVRPGAGERPLLEHAESLVADASTRAAALRRLAQAGLMHDADVSLTLSAGQYDLHPIAAPPVPDEELRDAVRWQLRGNLPYGPDEATIDFTRLPLPADASINQGGRPQLLAVAARLATVDAGVRALDDCGVAVAAVDIPEFAQRNLAMLQGGQSAAAAESCIAWLSFEADACLLTVQLDGELCFARRFQAQGASLLVAGAPGGAGEVIHGANGTEAMSTEADSVTQYFIERVVVHAQRSLELFERQSGLPPVSQLCVAPHSCATALARTISERTGVASEVFSVAGAFDLGPSFVASPAATQPNPDWLIAAGAALRDTGSPLRRRTLSIGSWFARMFRHAPATAHAAA